MAWTSKFFESHHIKVKSVPGKGLCISGKEQDIRSAMVEVFCSQYHDIELLYINGKKTPSIALEW